MLGVWRPPASMRKFVDDPSELPCFMWKRVGENSNRPHGATKRSPFFPERVKKRGFPVAVLSSVV